MKGTQGRRARSDSFKGVLNLVNNSYRKRIIGGEKTWGGGGLGKRGWDSSAGTKGEKKIYKGVL